MFITNSGWCLSPLQLSTTLTQYRGCTCLQLQGHSIPNLGWCRGSGVNRGQTLNQHCVNMWITSFCRDLQYCYSRVEHPIAPGCTPQIKPGYPVLQPGVKKKSPVASRLNKPTKWWPGIAWPGAICGAMPQVTFQRWMWSLPRVKVA